MSATLSLEAICFGRTGRIAVVMAEGIFTTTFISHILTFASERKELFAPSAVLDNNVAAHRKSRTIKSPEPFWGEIQSSILHNFADICNALRMDLFQISRIEAELTFHRDGDYYRVHRDNSGLMTRSRRISYVYYFSADPGGFEGGELRLYDEDPGEVADSARNGPIGDRHDDESHFVTIRPEHNRMVFFDSSLFHEVLPVRSDAVDFLSGRGTLLGWIRTFEVFRSADGAI